MNRQGYAGRTALALFGIAIALWPLFVFWHSAGVWRPLAVLIAQIVAIGLSFVLSLRSRRGSHGVDRTCANVALALTVGFFALVFLVC